MNENKVCKICGSKNLKVLFNGNIRDGSYGNLSASDYKVLHCLKCEVRFLNKLASSELYESEDYRKTYCGSNQLENYRNAHDELWNKKLNRIGIHNCRNKIIADFGAGGGSFLDALQGFAKKTIAIEPNKYWHDEISKKHQVFSYGKEFVKTNIKLDIAVSFDVIEHIPTPETYLKEIYNSLSNSGELILVTPNSNEILFDLAKESFEPFYYRTAHSYYFNENSIQVLLKQIGFKNLTIGFHHEMDISNLIHWLKDGKPTGKNKNKIFGDEANRYFCSHLEKIGKASHLWVQAKK